MATKTSIQIKGNLVDVPEQNKNDVPIEYIVKKIETIMYDLNQTNVMIILAETGSGKSVILSPELHQRFGRTVLISEPTILTTISNPEGVAKVVEGYIIGKNVGYKTGFSSVDISDATGVLYLTTKTLSLMLTSRKLQQNEYREQVFLVMDEAHILSPEGEQLIAILKSISLYCKQPQDPFIIILSATIDPKIYANYFETTNIVKVKGSSSTRELFYTDNTLSCPESYITGIVRNIVTDVQDNPQISDILIFCPTKNMMRKLQRYMKKKIEKKIDYIQLESMDVQTFSPNYISTINTLKRGYDRKIIFATPIAETGVNLPKLRYVIDVGFKNFTFLDPSRGITIGIGAFPISKDSMIQRIGRVGRNQIGFAYLLYPSEIEESCLKLANPPGIHTEKYEDFYLWILQKEFETQQKFQTFSTRLQNMEDLMHRQLLSVGFVNGKQISEMGKVFQRTTHLTCQEFKFLLLGRAYGLRVSDLATMIASLAHLSGNLTPANDYIMDEMINLFIYLSLHTNSTLTVPMTKNLEKQQKEAQSQFQETNLIKMFKDRFSHIQCIIDQGINPFTGISLYQSLLTDQPWIKIYPIICIIKTCYYLAFIDNILRLKNDVYINNRGIEIPLACIAAKLGSIIYSFPPKVLIYHHIVFHYNDKLEKKIFLYGLSSMDGFVNVDSEIEFEIINLDQVIKPLSLESQLNVKSMLGDYFSLLQQEQHPLLRQQVETVEKTQ